MSDLHSIAVVASVAAGASLLTLAVTYLLTKQGRGSSPPDCASSGHCVAVKTPEPFFSSSQAGPSSLFSPVNKLKRPDPYDTQPRNTYLSWDDYFMALAFLSAERSKDPNKQVGACIVNSDNIILSIGYNGFPRGCADSALPWSKRARSGSILDTKYPYVVHAEANALLNKNQAHVAGARIYVTLFPCNECAKLIIQAGIKEVIFHEAKLEPTGQRPATMERAAAADAAADRLAEAEQELAAAGLAGPEDGNGTSKCTGGGSHKTPEALSACDTLCPDAAVDEVQSGVKKTAQKKFGVGASDDVDASYAASQRLLMLAGVKLRQHTLQRSIQLGPACNAS